MRIAAIPLVLMMHDAPMPRCGTFSPGPMFTAESKVRRTSVMFLCTRHSHSARKVSTLSFSTPWSPNSLSPHLGLSFGVCTQPWTPNSLSEFLLQPLFTAPLLRELAAYLVSSRPSVVTAVGICGELFNSSHSPPILRNIHEYSSL